MKKSILLASILTAMCLTACGEKEVSVKDVQVEGQYLSLLPCASCGGILEGVVLQKDKKFQQASFYFGGKENSYVTEFGTFERTEDGSRVILTTDKGQKTQFLVEKDHLVMLDVEGQKIDSEFADMYVFQKLRTDQENLEGKTVKGVFLKGAKEAVFQLCGKTNTYIVEDSETVNLFSQYKDLLGNTEAPYTPVMLEVEVSDLGKPADNFPAQYSGVLRPLSIKSMELLMPETYCKK